MPLIVPQEKRRAAVRAVYGFAEEEDILTQLLALNLSIAEEEEGGFTLPRRPGNEGLADTRLTTVAIRPKVRLS